MGGYQGFAGGPDRGGVRVAWRLGLPRARPTCVRAADRGTIWSVNTARQCHGGGVEAPWGSAKAPGACGAELACAASCS